MHREFRDDGGVDFVPVSLFDRDANNNIIAQNEEEKADIIEHHDVWGFQ